MNSSTRVTSARVTPALVKATVGLGVTALLVAGCASGKAKTASVSGSSGGATSSSPVASSAGSLSSSPMASSSMAITSAASSPPTPLAIATVQVKMGPPGAYLADAAGRTLYLFNADKTSASTCYGKCATAWPPFITSAAPQVAGKASAALVGTSTRTDGTTQVTYDGHPLYYFKSDAMPGETGGQGVEGVWWLVTPAGAAIGAAKAAVVPPAPTKPATVTPTPTKITGVLPTPTKPVVAPTPTKPIVVPPTPTMTPTPPAVVTPTPTTPAGGGWS